MLFGIGLGGLGLLGACSLAFGVAAHVVIRARSSWLWLAGATGWFVGGLFFSEVLFGTSTIDEIQPIVDGLAFDESLLGGLIVGVAVVLVTRYLSGAREVGRTTALRS
jgi:hypothetical protein